MVTTGPAQSDHYPINAREDVIRFVPSSAASFLDVGCGAGGFGQTLRRTFGESARIVGVEAVPSQALASRNRGFDAVHEGYFPEIFSNNTEKFDCIFFNDVLEHILDPWDTLARSLDFLTPNGRIIAAIPSIQYAPVVYQLMRGRWDYAESGTLDRTHIRFFTRKTMVEMFESSGYQVEVCAGSNSLFSSKKWRRLKVVSPILGDAQWLHFIVVARPLRR